MKTSRKLNLPLLYDDHVMYSSFGIADPGRALG